MEIPINAKVMCQDGDCGHVTCVIINPVTDKLTHVVVKDDHTFKDEHIVPIGLVEETASESLRLTCNRDVFKKMDSFIEHHYIQAEKIFGAYPANRHVYLPYGWPIYEDYADIKNERVPPGEITFHRSAKVEASDGPVGKVDEFLVDPKSGDITHLIMREGHIWDQKDVSVPLSEIDHIEDEVVYLKLSKDEIAALPTIPLKHRD